MLKQYNRTTGYLYGNELDRKRLRYQEQLLTAREFQDRVMYNDSVKKASALLWTQISQYMINAVDEARIKAFEDFGVKKVVWRTMKDEKVCEDCDANNGKTFDIDNLPPKHYGCRCYLTPVVN
jgi:SPP1 gp7 family putative phage head morphogenesis protein